MARTAEKILVASQDWTDKVLDCSLEDLFSGSGDQPEISLTINEMFPPLRVLSDISEETLDGLGPQDSIALSDIWDKTSRTRLLEMPVHRGILPERASHQIAGARAALVSRLTKQIFAHLDGRRPG